MKTKILALNILVGFTILILIACLKIYFNGKEELIIAEEFFKNKNHAQAMTHYERAIQWHIPGSGIAEIAAEKLWKITLSYESASLTNEALKSCRLLRGAFYSTRSLWTPGKKWINLCNEKIAQLMVSQSDIIKTDHGYLEEKKKRLLEKLQADKPPSTLGSILTEVGFFGWVTCTVLFLLKAVTPSAGLNPRPAIIFSTAFLLFYGIWILGMFTV